MVGKVTAVDHKHWRTRVWYTLIMVASSKSIAERFALPPPLLAGRLRLARFTRHDALALVRMGIIPEDASTELLNGLIVLKDRAARGQDPMTIGHDHSTTVERLSDLRGKIKSATRHVRSQQPLLCTEMHVPEPDFMVVRGSLADYSDIPRAADAYCVVEVADASYERDTGEKLAAYARAAIRQYIIINLRNRTAEVYASPDIAAGTYLPPQVIAAEGELSICVGENEFLSIPLHEVLP